MVAKPGQLRYLDVAPLEFALRHVAAEAGGIVQGIEMLRQQRAGVRIERPQADVAGGGVGFYAGGGGTGNAGAGLGSGGSGGTSTAGAGGAGKFGGGGGGTFGVVLEATMLVSPKESFRMWVLCLVF